MKTPKVQESPKRVLASTVIQFNLPAEPKPTVEPVKDDEVKFAEPEPIKERSSVAPKIGAKRPKKRSKENEEHEITKRTTRGMKRRRVDEEIEARQNEEDEAVLHQLKKNKSGLGLVINDPVEQVGSALRYEVIKKKS